MTIPSQEGGVVTAITVSTAPFSDMYYGEIPADFQERVREHVNTTLKKIEALTKEAKVDVNVVVEDSPSPANAIVAFAEKHGTDLIVIGNKGAGAIERFLIGSVSSQVVIHAPCSVLVVKK